MISCSHWGMFADPDWAFFEGEQWTESDRSWLDRGDGLPAIWNACREAAMENLRQWALRKEVWAS